MGKFAKGCLITAGIIILLGFICVAASMATGGLRQTGEMIANGDLSIDSDDMVVGVVGYNTEEIADFSDVDIKAADIKKLDIHVEGGRLWLRTTESDDFALEATESRYSDVKYYVPGNTLYLKREYTATDLLGNNGDDEEIVLYVPADCQLEAVDINLGAGEIDMRDLVIAGEMDIDLGAGEVYGQQMTIGVLNVKVGAGEAIFEDSMTEDMEVNVGMGNLEYRGAITKDLNAECSMGSVVFNLDGNEKEHNYSMDCAMGSIELEGRSYAGVASGVYLDNAADSEFRVNCAMGSIELYFTE